MSVAILTMIRSVSCKDKIADKFDYKEHISPEESIKQVQKTITSITNRKVLTMR